MGLIVPSTTTFSTSAEAAREARNSAKTIAILERPAFARKLGRMVLTSRLRRPSFGRTRGDISFKRGRHCIGRIKRKCMINILPGRSRLAFRQVKPRQHQVGVGGGLEF